MTERHYTIKLFDQNHSLITEYDLSTQLHPGTVSEMLEIFFEYQKTMLTSFIEDPAVSGQQHFHL